MIRSSFAIEAEDIIVHRLYEGVFQYPNNYQGFYLDVGAFHPIEHSNTYFFYRRGWRGVNVEPNPKYIDDFQRERPEDITLNAGLSDKAGEMQYHMFEMEMLNGFYGQKLLDLHVRNGQKYLGSKSLPCLDVPTFLQQYATRPIDLLNLDIETVEEPVLRAWDWLNHRPKVICIEIHAVAMDRVQAHPLHGLLTGHGYSLVSRVWQSAFFIDRKLLPTW